MGSPATTETIRQAEIAMGGSSAVMEQLRFLRRLGWAAYETDETIVAWAARNPKVQRLIWC